MERVIVCICLFYWTTVVPTDTSLLTTAKVSLPSVSWNVGFQTPDCQLLGHSLVNTNLEDIRVQGVTGGENEYWIGAHVQYTKWIKLVGCYNTWIDSTSSDNDSMSVLDCYQRCGGTNFGLSVKGCVCDISTHNIADGCMATTCPGHSNDICGTADVISGFTCLCIYETTNFPRGNEIGNCKLLASTVYGTTSVQSTDCGEEHDFVCEGPRPFYHDGKVLNWTEARLACIREGIYIYYNIFDTKRAYDNPGIYWGSLFRKQISTWGNKTPQGTEIDCLAASVSEEGTLIPFVRKCDTKLPLLCDQPEQKQAGSIHGNNVESEKYSGVLLLLVGAAGGILFTIMVNILSIIIYRLRRKTTNPPQNGHQEATPPETDGIQYEHLRAADREGGNIYNVLGPSSDSHGYITVI